MEPTTPYRLSKFAKSLDQTVTEVNNNTVMSHPYKTSEQAEMDDEEIAPHELMISSKHDDLEYDNLSERPSHEIASHLMVPKFKLDTFENPPSKYEVKIPSPLGAPPGALAPLGSLAAKTQTKAPSMYNFSFRTMMSQNKNITPHILLGPSPKTSRTVYLREIYVPSSEIQNDLKSPGRFDSPLVSKHPPVPVRRHVNLMMTSPALSAHQNFNPVFSVCSHMITKIKIYLYNI